MKYKALTRVRYRRPAGSAGHGTLAFYFWNGIVCRAHEEAVREVLMFEEMAREEFKQAKLREERAAEHRDARRFAR